MSELIENRYSGDMRKRLMAGASCLALMVLMLPDDVHAADRPDVWIELRGQLEAVGGNRSRAAEALGISPRLLYRMAERLGVALKDEAERAT